MAIDNPADGAAPDPSIQIVGPITVTKNRSVLVGMGWFRFDTIGAINTKLWGYSKGDSTTLTRFSCQWATATAGRLQITARALDADGSQILLSATVLTTGVWRHIAAQVDYSPFPAAPQGKIWINGVLDTSGAFAAALGAAATSNTDTLDARIMGREGSTDQCLDGQVEDFRLYGRAFTDAEILSIFTLRGHDMIRGGLLHHYPLNEASAGNLVASVPVNEGERINATPVNGNPTYTTRHVSGVRRRGAA